MRKRRRPRGQSISLFPFLSVLSATIGTLALLISGMTSMSLLTSDQIVERTKEGSMKAVRYVECRKEGIVIHPEKSFVHVESIGRGNTQWDDLLQHLRRNGGDQSLLLLIRPNGITSFRRAESGAKRVGITYGYDPINQAGELKFASSEGRPK